MGYSPWSCKDSDMTECAYTIMQSWSIYGQIKNTPRRVWDHIPKSSMLIFLVAEAQIGPLRRREENCKQVQNSLT